MIKTISGKKFNDLEQAMELVNLYGININYSEDSPNHIPTENLVSIEGNEALGTCNLSYNIDPLNAKYFESNGVLKNVKGFLKKIIRKGVGWYIVPLVQDQVNFNSAVTRTLNEYAEFLHQESVSRKKSDRKKIKDRIPDDFYCKLEEKYKLNAAELKKKYERIAEILKDKQVIIDCGCGSGRLLRVLQKSGKKRSFGIDSNSKFVERCRAKGLNAVCADAETYLSRLDNDCIDAIVSVHMIEYLSKDELFRFIKVAFQKLKSGGLLVLETNNPLFLGDYTYESSNSLIHPEILKFLAEYIGFEVDQPILTDQPGKECLLDENVVDDVAGKNFRMLNNHIYHCKSYMLLCHKI